MAKKTIYKTVIMMEVLSDEPIPDGMTIGDIDRECDEGMYSGVHGFEMRNVPLKGLRAVKAVMKQGSSPDFFNMDEIGNEF